MHNRDAVVRRRGTAINDRGEENECHLIRAVANDRSVLIKHVVDSRFENRHEQSVWSRHDRAVFISGNSKRIKKYCVVSVLRGKCRSGRGSCSGRDSWRLRRRSAAMLPQTSVVPPAAVRVGREPLLHPLLPNVGTREAAAQPIPAAPQARPTRRAAVRPTVQPQILKPRHSRRWSRYRTRCREEAEFHVDRRSCSARRQVAPRDGRYLIHRQLRGTAQNHERSAEALRVVEREVRAAAAVAKTERAGEGVHSRPSVSDVDVLLVRRGSLGVEPNQSVFRERSHHGHGA